ncbi:endoplasmic reticulum protein [Thamnocephalis sphaerospora]|uniref:Endoplasmic reticulum protein n=1 Tax=Thamnocephalis sphaerospora TaxID=78915 RepID=A0A4P9XNQ5_9FUNG|nr:endoplasmic reticulum protein [Thamnocephalis sphaerospora]|eukprot:RKP07617.1 endoplasmic reticulum protein [Thamnocephalis sphaerospora]
MPALAPLLDQAAEAFGFPPYIIRLVTALLITYPTGFLFLRLPADQPCLKHLFSVGIALLLHIEVLGDWLGLVHLSLAALSTYVLAYTVHSRLMPQMVMLLTMLHLSLTHIARMDETSDYAKADFSGAQMVLVIKLTSFAFNVHDGRRKEQELNAYQKQYRIMKMPSLLEFMGYTFFFGGFLVGPAFEYNDYKQFCNMEIFREKVFRPSGMRASLSCLGQSAVAIGLLVTLGPVFPIHYCLSEEYYQASFLARFFYLQIASVLARMKYYFVWKLSESVCILTGLAFNGYDAQGNPRWCVDRVSNVRIMDYELAQSPRALMDSWNIGTNVWLRNYVYLRLTKPGEKDTFVATLATFTSSAIWHGFYAGYYLTFASGALTTTLARTMRRTFRALAVNLETQQPRAIKPAYDLAGWFLTQMTINHVVAPFQLLTLSASWSTWRANYFVVHLSMIALYLWLVYAGGARWVRRRLTPADVEVRKNLPASKPAPSGDAVEATQETLMGTHPASAVTP